ncbi:unnamed protein product [Closterium sp. NIES-65]|nr:unnamed protein product [Closterium sp. NIES-65]
MTSSAIGKCASDVSGPLLRAKLLPWAAAALFSATSRAFSAASSSGGRCAQTGGGAGEGAGAGGGSGGGGNLAAIKELRARTGAPVKDVKAALVAAGWDLDAAFTKLRRRGLAAAQKKRARVAAEGLVGGNAAFTELRRRGLAAAQKKRARVAAEGLVGVAVRRGVGAVAVEVNSETDFVARNDLFQLLPTSLKDGGCIGSGDECACKGVVAQELTREQATVSFDHPKLTGSRQLAEAVAEVAALTGENVRLRRAFLLPEPRPSGSVATYLHSSPGAGLGRIASLVSLSLSQPSGSSSSSSSREGSRAEAGSEAGAVEETGAAAAAAAAVGEGVAMHVVAMRPLYLRREDVPAEVVERESDVLRAQAVAAGKPAAVVEKMVAGRLGKFYGEVVLMEQPYALDDKRTVQVGAERRG